MHLKSVCWRENRVLVKSWNTELDNLMEIIIIEGINNFCEENSEYNLCALQTKVFLLLLNLTRVILLLGWIFSLSNSTSKSHHALPGLNPKNPIQVPGSHPQAYHLAQAVSNTGGIPRVENGRVSVSLHQFPSCHLYLDNRCFFNSKPTTTIGIWPYSCNSPKSLLATHSLTLSHLSRVQCFSARVLYDPLFIFLKPTHSFIKDSFY